MSQTKISVKLLYEWLCICMYIPATTWIRVVRVIFLRELKESKVKLMWLMKYITLSVTLSSALYEPVNLQVINLEI